MKRFSLALMASMMLLFAAPGCGNVDEVLEKNHEVIVMGIKLGVTKAAEFGLKKWGEKDPTAASEAAEKLAKNISEEIKPWILGDGKLKSSKEIQEFVNSSLFDGLPQEAKDAIAAAGAVLDVYLPAPDVNEKLTDKQVDYIVAFLDGVVEASGDFSPPPAGTLASPKKPNVWIK